MTASPGMPRVESESNRTKDDKNVTLDLEDRVTFEDFIEEPLPDDIVFPSKLNAFFRDRIRDLQSKNGHLRREVDESRDALEKLRKISKPEEPPEKSREAEGLRKKYRHQTAELEVLKAKCKRLEEKMSIRDIELENARLGDEERKEKEKNITDSATVCEEETPSIQAELSKKDDQIRVLSEKLQQTSAKLYETKNVCTSLRQEVNKAHKLLCREVGESVTVASLTNRPSGWRGRAEQVQQLQQKVAELHGKLCERDRSLSSKSSTSLAVSSEQRNVAYLRNLEKERRAQMENSARELRQAEIVLENSHRKLRAAQARIKILENELNNSKTNVALLNEKRIHDDQLVEALNGQLRAVEDRFREREHESRYQKEKAQEACNELRNELSTVRMQVELLKKKLEERETEIEKLREGTGRSRPERVWQSQSIKSSRATPAASPRNLNDPNEYVTMSLAAEAERQRLLELVTLLNRRLAKEMTDTDRINELWRQERKKNAKLETKLQRLELDRVGIARVNTGYRSKRSNSLANLPSGGNFKVEKIQFKLELLEEECLALKTRLVTVQQDKATDLAIYKKMLEQARRTFQDAFRGKMNYTAGCHSNVTI